MVAAMRFEKAVKRNAKLRLALAGPSGSGKTYTALALATRIGKRVAFIDTERGSASKYADLFAFDVLNLDPPYEPRRYVEALRAAASEGFDVVVVDSLSHAWAGAGGLLEKVDEIAKRSKSTNTFMAWRDATPEQTKLLDGLLAVPCHLIATMRSKSEYVIDRSEKGKSVPRKVGMAPVQRDGVEYEFDLFCELDLDHNLVVQKSRCSALADRVINKPGAELAAELLAWLDGAPVEPKALTPAVEPLPGPTGALTATAADVTAPIVRPSRLALRRLTDLRDIAAGIPRAGKIAEACDVALMDDERGKLSAERAGALIGRAKLALTEKHGWTEPEHWQAERELRRATRASEKRAAARLEEPPLQEPPEREPGEEG